MYCFSKKQLIKFDKNKQKHELFLSNKSLKQYSKQKHTLFILNSKLHKRLKNGNYQFSKMLYEIEYEQKQQEIQKKQEILNMLVGDYKMELEKNGLSIIFVPDRILLYNPQLIISAIKQNLFSTIYISTYIDNIKQYSKYFENKIKYAIKTGIDEYKKHLKDKYSSTKDIMDALCPICITPIVELMNQNRLLIELDCKHIFCYKCIIEWMKKELNCPLCRVNLKFDYNTLDEQYAKFLSLEEIVNELYYIPIGIHTINTEKFKEINYYKMQFGNHNSYSYFDRIRTNILRNNLRNRIMHLYETSDERDIIIGLPEETANIQSEPRYIPRFTRGVIPFIVENTHNANYIENRLYTIDYLVNIIGQARTFRPTFNMEIMHPFRQRYTHGINDNYNNFNSNENINISIPDLEEIQFY